MKPFLFFPLLIFVLSLTACAAPQKRLSPAILKAKLAEAQKYCVPPVNEKIDLSQVDPELFDPHLKSGYYTMTVLTDPDGGKSDLAVVWVKTQYGDPMPAGVDVGTYDIRKGDVVRIYFTEWVNSVTFSRSPVTSQGKLYSASWDKGGCISIAEKLAPTATLSLSLPLVHYIMPAQ